MIIDNFKILNPYIQNLCVYDDCFFKFEALIRNTDGNSPFYYNGITESNKTICLKTWYFETYKDYEQHLHQMKILCDLTNARLYLCLDLKSKSNFFQTMYTKINDLTLQTIQQNNFNVSLKKLCNITDSCASLKNSTKQLTVLFDIDTKDELVLNKVLQYLHSKQNYQPYILNTIKGYHVFCKKDFDLSDFNQVFCNLAVELKENAMGLVYHPCKEWNNEENRKD